MKLQIFYTAPSKETLIAVYDFINNKFGLITANKFLNKAEKIVDLISLQPLMYKTAEFDHNIRVALITKQTSLFYRITDDAVHLLFFWDNRQEPFIINKKG